MYSLILYFIIILNVYYRVILLFDSYLFCINLIWFKFRFFIFYFTESFIYIFLHNIIMNIRDNTDLDELKEIDKLLKEYKPYYTMYKKLLVVKNVKEGMSGGEAAEVVNVHRKTAENWVKSYNENGLDGLEPNYSNCGLECKLSDQQLMELKNLVLENPEKYDVKTVRKLIIKKYNVKYSYKQTWFILRRKLGLNYKGNKLVA